MGIFGADLGLRWAARAVWLPMFSSSDADRAVESPEEARPWTRPGPAIRLIPSGARMDLDRTLILGPRETWIAVVFTSSAGPNDLFDFYNREMPRFGWTGITRARRHQRAEFSRAERIATVQISRTTLGGSESR
jgi:hypothetical protein